MSEVFEFQAGEEALRRGHCDAAMRHFEKVLSFSAGQNRMLGLFELGEAFKLNSCLTSAILCYEEAMRMPTDGINTNVADEIRAVAGSQIVFCKQIMNIRSPLGAIFHPKRLSIEPINSCNYSCYKCLYPGMQRKKTQLDPSAYEGFISNWARRFGQFEEIIFTGGGEALLCKRLEEIVRISSRWMPQASLNIGTNLSLLTRERAEALIAEGLKNWEVSLDTDDPEEQKMITGGVDSFDRVIKNIGILWKALDNGRAGTLEIAAHRPLDERYQEKMDSIAALVDGMCSRFRCAPYSTLMGRKETPGMELWEKTMTFNEPPSPICLELWEHMVVTSDGAVRRCCSDMFDCPETETFGNIFANSLDEIVFNEKRAMVQNKMHGHDVKDLYLCNKCLVLYKDTSAHKVGDKYA